MMVFSPHTNTVILLEPYCGTITEPGLPAVVSASQDVGNYAYSRENNLGLPLGCHTC